MPAIWAYILVIMMVIFRLLTAGNMVFGKLGGHLTIKLLIRLCCSYTIIEAIPRLSGLG